MTEKPVPRSMIEAAADRIAGHARTTPVMRLGTGAFGSRADVSLKLESLQHAGSFKTRGAFNNLHSLDVPAAGVAAASGGNHGAAVAYAAGKRDVKATIFVPEISPAAKIDAIRRFGADVVVGGAQYDDAQAACDRFVAETGALKIHPFAAMETIAGQGTLGREWDLQEPDLDTVLVAVGGGGLISGIASWFAGSKVKVVGVEPEGSRALQAAFEAKGPVEVKVASVATAFPSGQAPLDVKLADVRAALEAGADEIDMVIDRGAFLSGRIGHVYDEVVAVKEACGDAHLKVILETGELGTYDAVRKASLVAIAGGADFIKTSTGKVTPAATLPVTLWIRRTGNSTSAPPRYGGATVRSTIGTSNSRGMSRSSIRSRFP